MIFSGDSFIVEIYILIYISKLCWYENYNYIWSIYFQTAKTRINEVALYRVCYTLNLAGVEITQQFLVVSTQQDYLVGKSGSPQIYNYLVVRKWPIFLIYKNLLLIHWTTVVIIFGSPTKPLPLFRLLLCCMINNNKFTEHPINGIVLRQFTNIHKYSIITFMARSLGLIMKFNKKLFSKQA